MDYNTYTFLYPPRATALIRPADLDKYDTGEFVATPKYDGSAICIFLNGTDVIIRNRHNEEKTRVPAIDFGKMHSGKGWMCVVGELFDKSKRDERGQIIKGFAMWDVIVYAGKQLIGSTFGERLDLMENLWPSVRMKVTDGGIVEYDHLCFTEIPDVYKAPAYTGNFSELYDDLVQTQLYEGIVLKRLDAKLELGYHESNNSSWQLKIRRTTKNYKH